jgi:hypothetical protein
MRRSSGVRFREMTAPSVPPIETPVSVPLTTWQRARLAGRIALQVLGAGILVLVAYSIVEGMRIQPTVRVVLYACIFVAGIAFAIALTRPAVRDLMSGVAWMQDDVVLRSWTQWSTRRLPASYVEFKRLGTLRVSSKLEWIGVPCRVTHSPASGIVWTATPIAYIAGEQVSSELRRARAPLGP